jgi:hypothetical protein
MPVNTQVVSAIQAGIVPSDRNCPTDGQSVVNLVQDFCTVQTVTQQIPGAPSGDSIAAQALQIAQLALTTSQQALNAIPARRSSTAPLLQPAGDSVMPIVWSPAMPDTNYSVLIIFYGPNTPAAQFYGYRVVDASRTVDGCQVRLDNVPAGTSVSFVIEALTPP